MNGDIDAFNIKLHIEQSAIECEHAILPFPLGFLATWWRHRNDKQAGESP